MKLFVAVDSLKNGIKAVDAGADGVIFSVARLSGGSKGLSGDNCLDFIKSCHVKGVLAFGLLDAAAFDDQLFTVRDAIDRLNIGGADGIVVSDPGIARVAKASAPELALIAGSRLSLTSSASVSAAASLGFSAAFLAPELTENEVKTIARSSPIPLLITVQGRLCTAYGGKCRLGKEMSGFGKCSEACREEWSFFGGAPQKYLSLADLCLIDKIPAVSECGADSAVIDAREKSGEYVSVVTSAWSRSLEAGKPSSEARRLVFDLFSVGGTTEGYFAGAKNRMSGETSEAAPRVMKRALKKFREPEKKVTVDITVNSETVTVSGLGAEASCPVPESGDTPLTAEGVLRALVTLPSFFRTGEVTVNAGVAKAPLVAAVSGALEGLSCQLTTPKVRAVGEWKPGVKRIPYTGESRYIYNFARLEQFSAGVLAFKPAMIVFPLAELTDAAKKKVIEKVIPREITVAASLPAIVSEEEWPELLKKLAALKSFGTNTVVCRDLGQAAAAASLGFAVRGGMGIDVCNSQAIRQIKALGISSVTAAPEMDYGRIKELSLSLPCEVIVYGRREEAIFENCIIRQRTGTCTCESAPSIVDKNGKACPLARDSGCRNVLYSSDKLYLADKKLKIETMGAEWLTLAFTTENVGECTSVCRDYYYGAEFLPPRTDRGHFGKI